jgi:hypothetical protein
MIDVKNALEKVVIYLWWTKYVQSLFNRQNGQHVHALIALVKETFGIDAKIMCIWLKMS